jgi:hypothetical protein
MWADCLFSTAHIFLINVFMPNILLAHSSADPRLVTAVENKMGPRNPASRGQMKKITFHHPQDHCFQPRRSL